MADRPEVDILLATWNPGLLATSDPGSYLRQQLESIVSQTADSWRLIVRDDASTEGTPATLRDFARQNPGKVKVLEDGGCRVGPVGGFPPCWRSRRRRM